MARVERRQCSRSIQSHEPVTLRAAQGRIGQRLHSPILAQPVERLQNRAVSHGLHPHALERFIHLGQSHYVAENQFTFAAGIAGIHDGFDLFVSDQPQ